MEVVSGVHTVLLSCVRGVEVRNSLKKKKERSSKDKIDFN